MAKRSKGEEHRIIDEKLQPKLNNAELELRRFHKQQHESLRSGVESGKINLSDIFRPTSEFGRLKRVADASTCSGYSISALMRSNLTDDELETICAPKKVKTYTFMSKLETQHIEALLPVVNDLVFAEPQTVDSLRDLFECKKKYVRVKSNGLLAYMMYLLSADEWICQNWQMVAKSQETFASKKGVTLSHSNLSRSLHMMAKRMNYPADKQGIRQLNTELYETVKGLKR
jgi:ferritin-like protein